MKPVHIRISCLFFSVLSAASAQTYLGNVTGFSVDGKMVTISADTQSVRFVFYQPDVVRIDYLPLHSTVFDSSLVVIRDTADDVPFSFNDVDSALIVSSTSIVITCSKNPLRLSFSNTSGKVLLSEPGTGGLSSFQNERMARFVLSSDDHFYGTGERGTSLDKRGQAFLGYNTQVFGYSGPVSTMNINVPFVASTNGYAVYFENTYPGWFDFGVTNPNEWYYQADSGELSYFFIAAPTVPALLERYTWLTGREPLPPQWAFGYLQSKYGYRNETEAQQVVQTMRQKQIPCDAIILDLYWFTHMGDLSWNETSWPQPFTMIAEFLSQGIKTIVITEPYFVEQSSNFYEASNLGYLAKDTMGQTYVLGNWWSCGCNAGLIDITNPTAREWFWGKHPPFMGSNLAGIWTDLGEPERHPDDMRHYLGSAKKIHNIYNLLWAETVFNGFNELRSNSRFFNLTRSGYAGIQRYGVIPWSGDVAKTFDGLAVQLPMLLNMGMSGLAYHNSDIGGFTGSGNEELYIRWMEYGTFCPITRAHGVGQPTEPWGFGAVAESVSTKFIRLRYQLIPYIYTLAFENYQTGLPLARPLFFDHPTDPNLFDEGASYMWGNAFLVSPVMQSGQTSKNLYLPAGTWFDYWTDSVYHGGQYVTVQAPLDQMPLFVKSGSIIPMQPVMNYSDERPLDTLIILTFPDSTTPGSFTLYEDDGRTLEYQTRRYTQTQISQQFQAQTLDVRIGAAVGDFTGKVSNRVYLVEAHNLRMAPDTVTLNDQQVTLRSSLSDLRKNGVGYFYDNTLDQLFIYAPGNTDSTYHIVARFATPSMSVGSGLRKYGFRLYQNYPNPFNPETDLRFEVGSLGYVSLKVFDVLGREVATLVDGVKQPGEYTVRWNTVGVPSGVYVGKLQSGSNNTVRKLLLLK